MWKRRAPGDSSRPLVLGHRGASAIELENTVAAFERARRDGADGVELDVLLCATGEVVVFHDDDLARLAGRPERIADLRFDAVREVELRSGQRIPTLEEALEACGPELLVNIELKIATGQAARIPALVDRVADIVERTGVGPRILASSFNPWAVARWMWRAPSVSAGLLFEAASALPLRRAWAAPLLRPFGLHPERVLASAARIARWHRRGYFVAVWTVDDPAELRAFGDAGADAVISNDPARAIAALR
jgi:glycerophosphoryl diester phosphodiesterase